MNHHELTEAAGEYRYHWQRLTELSADVATLADSAADASRALLATAHELGEGRTVADAARLLTAMLGSEWSAERIERTFADAMALESRREALRNLLEAHRIAGDVRGSEP